MMNQPTYTGIQKVLEKPTSKRRIGRYTSLFYDKKLLAPHGTLAFGSRGRLYTLDLENDILIEYSGVPNMFNPSFSSDGTRLAFGDHHVYTIDPNDEKESVEITQISPTVHGDPLIGSGFHPNFHLGNLEILYNYREPSDNIQLRRQNVTAVSNSEEENPFTILEVPDLSNLTDAAWSPNRNVEMIALQAQQSKEQPQIYIIEQERYNTSKWLIQSHTTDQEFPFGARSPAWSPSGNEIAFTALHKTEHGYRFAISLRTASNLQSKTGFASAGELDEFYPVFSPDGKYIAFMQSTPGSNDLTLAFIHLETEQIIRIEGIGGGAIAWYRGTFPHNQLFK